MKRFPDNAEDPPLSVCVPACNEAQGIRGMLTSVFEQDYGGDLDVIVCANGCTDRTEAVVREFARRRAVRLLVTDVACKSNAWNWLLREARNDLIAFADADVRIRPGALGALVQRVRQLDRTVAVGALTRPESSGCDYLTRILNPPPQDHGCIVGRLYVVDRTPLRARFRARGFEEMPALLSGEDAWLSVVLGRGWWTTEPTAIVEYRPARWSELLAVERRCLGTERQLLTEYGHLLEDPTDEALFLNESRDQRRARRLERWRNARTPGERLGIVLNFLAKRLLRWLAERQLDRQEGLLVGRVWERAETSKRWPQAHDHRL